MRSIENKLRKRSENNAQYEPEYRAVKEINRLALNKNASRNDILKIAEVFNAANETIGTIGGTAWMDLGLHIEGLIKSKGHAYQRLKNGNLTLE